MDKNYNRTIDGMASRDSGVSRSIRRVSKPVRPATRRVGELPTKNRRPVKRVVRRQKPVVQPLESNENFGLNSSTISKERAKLKANEDFLKPVSSLDFDLSSDELKKGADWKQSSKKQRKKLAVKVICAVLAVFVILGGGFLLWGNGLISRLTDGESGLLDLFGSAAELRTGSNGRTNVLVFGTSGYEMSGSGHDGAQLTDSIMVISLDQSNKDVAMVSLPRDLYVGNTCTATGKINEVYWCANMQDNNEQAGSDALIKAVEGMLGVDIQYRVHVDWGALIQVVDGIGGITVTLDEDVSDYAYTGTVIQAGVPTNLNGEQALGLARARHGTVGGDFSRGKNQQKILSAIQEKITTNGVGLTEAINLVNAAGDNVRMNFSIDELKTIFSLSKEISLGSMRQIPLTNFDGDENYMTTADINGISYVVPVEGVGQYTALRNYVKRMLSTNPADRESPKLAILNGSGVLGAAASEQAKLETAGYQISYIDDAPEGVYNDAYIIYDVSGRCPGTKNDLQTKYQLEVKPASELPNGVNTTDIDFVIILGSK